MFNAHPGVAIIEPLLMKVRGFSDDTCKPRRNCVFSLERLFDCQIDLNPILKVQLCSLGTPNGGDASCTRTNHCFEWIFFVSKIDAVHRCNEAGHSAGCIAHLRCILFVCILYYSQWDGQLTCMDTGAARSDTTTHKQLHCENTILLYINQHFAILTVAIRTNVMVYMHIPGRQAGTREC